MTDSTPIPTRLNNQLAWWRSEVLFCEAWLREAISMECRHHWEAQLAEARRQVERLEKTNG